MLIEASYHQERLWFIDQFEYQQVYKTNPLYHNIPIKIDIKGSIEKPRLEKTLNAVVSRHESLRTGIIVHNNLPFQKVYEQVNCKIEFIDLSVYQGLEKKSQIDGIIDSFNSSPFNLETAPLFRCFLIQIDKDYYQLLFLFHHIISDRYSFEIFLNELFLLYDDPDIRLSDVHLQYSKFSEWQKKMSPKMINYFMGFWKRFIENTDEKTDLPTDVNRELVHVYENDIYSACLDEDLSFKINDYCQQKKIQKETFFLTVFRILLAKYIQVDNITIGKISDNRVQKELSNVIGPISNLLVVCGNINANHIFSDLLIDEEKKLQDIHKYQSIPFEKLVLELGLENDMARTALFDILFRYDKALKIPDIAGLKCELEELNIGWGKYDINIQIIEDTTLFSVNLAYNSLYFQRETMKQLINFYSFLLKECLNKSDEPIGTIHLISDSEKENLIYLFNTDFRGGNHSVLTLFNQIVNESPNSVAVSNNDIKITYKELDKRSSVLADYLLQCGVQEGSVIGLLLEKSVDLIISIWGIIKAGGIYLPLDSQLPKLRMDYLIKDSNVHSLITSKYLLEAFDLEIEGNTNTLLLENLSLKKPFQKKHFKTKGQQILYIIYTSGTSGLPKGTMVSNNNLMQLLMACEPLYRFSSKDNWVLFHSIGFDFSIWEIFGPLLGGKLIIAKKEDLHDLERYISVLEKEMVTVLNITPSVFYSILHHNLDGRKFAFLRHIIFGGEALNFLVLKKWMELGCEAELINMFGITETTVHSTFKKITLSDIEKNQCNIGKPLPHVYAYIIDKFGNILPKGIPGELVIGGQGVSEGYVNNEHLTSERFVVDTYRGSGRLYKSGDKAKINDNNELIYLGRIDNQVKIRGFRIELKEIESNILQYEQISEALCVLMEINNEKSLCAYYVSDCDIESDKVHVFLKERLPSYMLPVYYKRISSFPVNINGKIDITALPSPVITVDKIVSPSNETEYKLREIWSEILDIKKESIGVTNNFFLLGGHSLKATVLSAAISKEFNVKIPLINIFKEPTIFEMTQFIHTLNWLNQSDSEKENKEESEIIL